MSKTYEIARDRTRIYQRTQKKTMILLLENDKYMNEAFDLIDQLAHDGDDQEKRESLI